MTDCREFERLLASDDADELGQARRHALECVACRPIYDAQQRLVRRVEETDWTLQPPSGLEDRVRAEVRRRLDAQPRPAQGRRWIALAAGLLLAVSAGIWIGLRPGAGPTQASNLLVVEALVDARRAERQHARAIASLERSVESRLARADDPALPASEAALLLAYRDRLASLESTIQEISEYLRDNPAHPGARTVLLAAYRDKTEVLREIIALGEPT